MKGYVCFMIRFARKKIFAGLFCGVCVGIPALFGGFSTALSVAADTPPVGAPSYTYGCFTYGILESDDTIEIRGFDQSVTSVSIPSQINGIKVTSIGDAAFEACDDLTSVTIPAGVTYLGNAAFRRCTNLSSVTLPEGLKTIDGVVFKDCTSLKTLDLPDSLTAIGMNAFDGSGLVSDQVDVWYVDKWVVGIGNAGKKVTGAVTVKNGTVGIAEDAFSKGSDITSVTLPDSVKYLNAWAFTYCPMTTVSLGKGQKVMGAQVFGGCKNLTSVVIPEGTTEIPSGTFVNCTSLTSVTIPKSVTKIGKFAFQNCPALKNITYAGTTTQWNQITVEADNAVLTQIAAVCSNGSTTYKNSSATTTNNKTTTTATTSMRGDLDGDKNVTIQDAYTALLAYSKASAGLSSGLTQAQTTAADVDKDGKLTIQDAYKILLYYSKTSAGLTPSWS